MYKLPGFNSQEQNKPTSQESGTICPLVPTFGRQRQVIVSLVLEFYQFPGPCLKSKMPGSGGIHL